jgi:hypothetical protein
LEEHASKNLKEIVKVDLGQQAKQKKQSPSTVELNFCLPKLNLCLH